MPDKRLTPAREDIAAAHLKGQVQAKRFVEGRAMAAVTPVAPVRRRPGDDAPLDTQLLFGEVFTVYDEADGWSWGQAAFDGYVGYVPSDCLAAQNDAPTHRVTALRTYIFPEPNVKAPPAALISMNAKLSVTMQEGRFAELSGGGFVFVGHLAPLTAYASDHAAIAERYLGAPYLWGGRDSLGLDCSGLAQNVLERCGVTAPRDTDMQMNAIGAQISQGPAERVQRGDFVFWKGHVAIMLDEARMIHANATDMEVSIHSLQGFADMIEDREGPVTAVRRLGA